jgi:hypothetical protein
MKRSAIWRASSRVGARIRARGPPPRRPLRVPLKRETMQDRKCEGGGCPGSRLGDAEQVAALDEGNGLRLDRRRHARARRTHDMRGSKRGLYASPHALSEGRRRREKLSRDEAPQRCDNYVTLLPHRHSAPESQARQTVLHCDTFSSLQCSINLCIAARS